MLPSILYINSQYSPAGHMMGDEFLELGVGGLMVATWLAISPWTWRLGALVLYLCTGVIGGCTSLSWCAAGGMGFVLYGIKWALFGSEDWPPVLD